jgi:hypothetical protein
MNKLKSERDKAVQALVQYFKDTLLIEPRMNSERSVMRRIPTHCIAKPTFESIEMNLRSVGETAGRLERLATQV